MNQCQILGMVGYGGSVDAPENLPWMGFVINAQKQKSIRALTILDFAGFPQI